MAERISYPFDPQRYKSFADAVLLEASTSNRPPNRYTGSKLSGLCHPINFALALDARRRIGVPFAPFALQHDERSSIPKTKTPTGVSLTHCARLIRHGYDTVSYFHTAALIHDTNGLWYLDASASQFGLPALDVRHYPSADHQNHLDWLAHDGIYIDGNTVSPDEFHVALSAQHATTSYKEAIRMYDLLPVPLGSEIKTWAQRMRIDLGTRVLHTQSLLTFGPMLGLNGLEGIGLSASAMQAIETLREIDLRGGLRASGQVYP